MIANPDLFLTIGLYQLKQPRSITVVLLKNNFTTWQLFGCFSKNNLAINVPLSPCNNCPICKNKLLSKYLNNLKIYRVREEN